MLAGSIYAVVHMDENYDQHVRVTIEASHAACVAVMLSIIEEMPHALRFKTLSALRVHVAKLAEQEAATL